MKFLKNVLIRYVVLGTIIFGAGGLFFWPQIQANIFKKVKNKVDKATDKVKKSSKKGIKDVSKTAKKGIKEVEKVGKDALKELTKLGLPTDPKKLVLLALSKMPAKEVTKLANQILDIFAGELSDIKRLTAVVFEPLDELYRPIPPLPSGLPIPIPIVGSVMNVLLGLTQSTEIHRSNRETFACLKAFHKLTNNKYINEEEKKLIKSFEKAEKTKGIIGKKVDLKGIANTVTSKVKEIEKPIMQLSEFIQKELNVFMGPLEQIANVFRPITLAAFIPLGPIYNSVLFCFKLKENHELFVSAQETLGNSLNPVAKSKNKIATLLDLKKNPVTGSVMKLLDTMKAPADQTLEKIDEMFVDPLTKIPWGTHSLVILLLKVMNLAGGVVDAVMGTIIEALVTTLTGGAGATVSGPVSSVIKGVINVDAICDFLSQTFTWSYIRYLKNRIDRLNKLTAQARADGVIFDSQAFKAEVNKILGVIAEQEKKDSKNKKSSKDKKDSKAKKDKKDKKSSQDKSEKKSSKDKKKTKEKKDKQKDSLAVTGAVSNLAISPVSSASQRESVQAEPAYIQQAVAPVAPAVQEDQSVEVANEEESDEPDFEVDIDQESDDNFELDFEI